MATSQPAPLANPFAQLPATGGESPREIHAIVDTPKGGRHKHKYDEALGLFKLERVPMDEAVFVGCLVVARLIGVIEATQVEVGATRGERNDRLIAVARQSPTQTRVTQLRQVEPVLLDEIEHFFVAYTSIEGKHFTPQRRSGPARARHVLAQGMKAFETKK